MVLGHPNFHLHPRNSAKNSGRIHRYSHQYWSILHLLPLYPFSPLREFFIHVCLTEKGMVTICLLMSCLLNLFILHLMVILYDLTPIWGQKGPHVFQPKWGVTKIFPRSSIHVSAFFLIFLLGLVFPTIHTLCCQSLMLTVVRSLIYPKSLSVSHCPQNST